VRIALSAQYSIDIEEKRDAICISANK